MPLNEAEKEFIKELCNFTKDEDLVGELNRIRWEGGNEEKVTIDMVRKARIKMGIKKRVGGRGRIR